MQNRPAFTLIEVVLATFIFAVGGLGLAASAAAVAKQVSATTRRSDSAAIARARAEVAMSGSCDLATENVAGLSIAYTLGGSEIKTLDQRIERWDAFGVHRDRFKSAARCE